MPMPLVPPPLLAAGAGVAQHLLARGRKATPASAVTAGLMAAASGALAVSAASGFRRRGTTLHPQEPDKASVLVTDGPNRFTRNPMYTGLTGVLLAHAVLRRSWPAALAVVPFVAVVDRVQIRAEEAALRRRFGSAYDDYCARTPRWLGPA
jgi:protein-S-isoprenylcysteine O-methyltransferase Ste14